MRLIFTFQAGVNCGTFAKDTDNRLLLKVLKTQFLADEYRSLPELIERCFSDGGFLATSTLGSSGFVGRASDGFVTSSSPASKTTHKTGYRHYTRWWNLKRK